MHKYPEYITIYDIRYMYVGTNTPNTSHICAYGKLDIQINEIVKFKYIVKYRYKKEEYQKRERYK